MDQPIQTKSKLTFPEDIYDKLEVDCQKLVREAEEGDPETQFLVGKFLFEGSNNFPQNNEIAIDYLVEAINNGSIESAFYYCQIILDGKLSQNDLEQAEVILAPFLNEENSALLTIFGKIQNK